MQKPREYVQLAMPVEVLEEAQISEGDVLQMHVKQGKIIIEKVTGVANTACSKRCEDCPCKEKCEEHREENGGIKK